MKKVTFSGKIVGKSVSAIWKDGKKTEENKHYIQLLDTDKDDFGNTKATLTDVKVTEETYVALDLEAVIEIDVKETEMNGKVYYSELK